MKIRTRDGVTMFGWWIAMRKLGEGQWGVFQMGPGPEYVMTQVGKYVSENDAFEYAKRLAEKLEPIDSATIKITTHNGITNVGKWVSVKRVKVWLGLLADRYQVLQMDRAGHQTQVALYRTESEAFAHARELAAELEKALLTDAGHWKV